MDSNYLLEAPEVPGVVDEADILGMPESPAPGTEASAIEGGINPGLDTAEEQGLFLDDGAKGLPPKDEDGVPISMLTRPNLRRDNSVPAPAPLHLPPPAPPAPPTETNNPTDSLSLAQLRRLVTNMPTVEPTPYAFVYQDASTFEEELEEWFSYNVEEQAMILKTQSSFAEEWGAYNTLALINGSGYEEGSIDWTKTNAGRREDFIRKLLVGVQHSDPNVRLKNLEAIVYLLLGCWHETAGLILNQGGNVSGAENESPSHKTTANSSYAKSTVQLEWIQTNVQLILHCEGLPIIFDAMRASCLRTCGVDLSDQDSLRDGKEAERRELWCTMTSMYLFLEVARIKEKDGDLSIREAIFNLKPNLLMTLIDLISRLRWDETLGLPLAKVTLLTWKSILVCFGGLVEVEKAKSSFRDEKLNEADTRGRPLITASPLDYHLFRQEISSKYPAYNPPPSLFPLEPENNSILPPLKNHPSKVAGSHVFGSGLANLNGNGTSIFHQPVHIATPAPSPPPSPAGPGGKGGKKQNYQTNQLFPFLYPPLDETSNNLGGKGSTDLQDLLVGRKWEGSDIPASILEAAELFAKRMRATRAMKQLWEERVQFMKYERGWAGPDANSDVDPLNLSLEPKEEVEEIRVEKKEPTPPGSVEERMQAVERFYGSALPHLQSLVIVLIKVILSHVTTLVTQANGPNGLQSGFQFQENQNGNGSAKLDSNGVGGGQHDNVSSNEELDAVRTQEILDKSVSGILILLLKWFKVSHILKYEYLTQLLVDSSYIPLILKLLQLQEIERIVNYKCDREDLNFFHFCRAHSRLGIEEPEKTDPPEPESDSDDAAPPPIKFRRDETSKAEPETPCVTQPPEVDELGFPTNELPTEPITNFSWRAFFSSINYLRIMQKVCKNKAHRNLMLVSYKSSQFLRKSLKVPQPELRLYTLKLFKNQVPYCGRKWRQSNMRVITAVYLHCRPELRDDWLAGSDVDAEVDESVPLEQALRALTHWHNLKSYPEGMGARGGVLEEEQDFFRRELEKMDWGDEGLVDDGGQAEQQGWDMQVEGW